MGKTHFDPYEDDYTERGACGTLLGESSHTSMHWPNVNCKICIKRRADIEKSVAIDEENIINQMGSMAAFFAKEKQQEQS